MEQLGAGYLESLKNPKNRLTLIDGDGTVLYDSQADAAAMENHGDREEVREALASGAGEVTRMSDTIDEKTYYYAVKLTDGQVLRIASTTGHRVRRPVQRAALDRGLGPAGGGGDGAAFQLPDPSGSWRPSTSWTWSTRRRTTVERCVSRTRPSPPRCARLKEKQEEFTAITENMSEGFLVLDHPHGHPLLQHQRPAAAGLPRRPGGRPGRAP